MFDNSVDIYDVEIFKSRFPIIAKICEDKLQDMTDWYFGQCFQDDKGDPIEVHYVNETNENRSAIFEFTEDNVLIEYDMNNID